MSALYKNKYLLYSLVSFFTTIIFSFLNSYLILFFQFQQNINDTNRFIGTHIELFLLSTLVLAVLMLFILSIVGNLWASTFLSLLIFIIYGVANGLKLQIRLEPIYPYELSAIKQLNFFIPMVPTEMIIMLVVVIILSILAVIGLNILFRHLSQKYLGYTVAYFDKKMLYIRAGVLLVSVFYIFQFFNFNAKDNFFKHFVDPNANWYPESQLATAEKNGSVLTFMYNLPATLIEKPENYSDAKMAELTEKYAQLADEINVSRSKNQSGDVNVVYVMSESFSDPERLNGITLNSDPIPNIRKIMTDYSSGYNYATNYGGGTANIEFEALTSFSMRNFSPQITTPYQSIHLNRKYPTPAATLFTENNGYHTTFIHPFSSDMYRRLNVYRNFEFDSLIFQDGMTHFTFEDRDGFLSDNAAYDEVLYQLEDTSKKHFISLVTMQNHGAWDGNRYDNTIEASSLSKNQRKKELETYVQGIYYTDLETKRLLDEIDNIPEKTMIVFWGDHLPSVYSDDIIDENGEATLRETPLFVYTNFDTPKQDIGVVSPSMFMNHVLEIADMRVSPFYALTYELEKYIKVFERTALIDADGNTIDENELPDYVKELLDDYQLTQYDVFQGKSYLEKHNFFNVQ